MGEEYDVGSDNRKAEFLQMKSKRQKLEKQLDNAWSEYVRSRDKSCRKCFGGGSIAAHHAFGRRHLVTRWDIFNGVGLCYPCHINWAHRDPGGFSVWFRDYVGKEEFERLAITHRQVVKFTVADLELMLEVLTYGRKA